jgi:hypothetical protein
MVYALLLILSGFTLETQTNTLEGCLKQAQVLAGEVADKSRIIGVICTRQEVEEEK